MSYNTTDYSIEKRLHPMTLVYRGITNLPTILIPLYLIFFKNVTEEAIFLGITLFFLIFTIPMIILSYYYFSFYITNTELVIKSGVFSRKQRNIPIRRVQNVNVEQNFIQRFLGIAKVQLETAGDFQTEGLLEFVSKNDAGEIKQIIRSYQSIIENKNNEDQKTNEDALDKDDTEFYSKETPKEANFSEVDDEFSNVIFNMSLTDTIRYGMLRFRPVALAIGFWIFTFGQQFFLIPSMEELGIEELIRNFENYNYFQAALFVLAGIIGISVTSWILDIILTVNSYYGFTLSLDGDKLHVRYGLLTKRSGTIPLKKLQSMTIVTNPIAQRLNFYKLNIQTAGFGAASGAPEVAVPFAKIEDLEEIIKKIRNLELPSEYNKVSKKTIRRSFIRLMMLLSMIVVPLAFSELNFLWAYSASPLLLLIAYLRWKYRGYYSDEEIIIIKQGVWIRKLTIMPIQKLQTIHSKSSFFQRRLDLATLMVDSASSSYNADARIIDINKSDSEELMLDISNRFHKLHKLH